MKAPVAGGARFIGSNFSRYILENNDLRILNLDALNTDRNPRM